MDCRFIAVDIPFSIRLLAPSQTSASSVEKSPHNSPHNVIKLFTFRTNFHFSLFTRDLCRHHRRLLISGPSQNQNQNTGAHTEKANQRLLLKPTNPFRTASASQREISIQSIGLNWIYGNPGAKKSQIIFAN